MHIPNVEWATTCEPPDLKNSEVHIWRFDLPDLSRAESEMRLSLSVNEYRRADKFHFEKDRTNFVIRRGMLRKLLGRYVGVKPADLHFIYNDFDKPALETDTPIVFNASSSGDVGIVGITLNGKLGVDVEFIDPTFPQLDIVERYFSSSEVQAIRALQTELQTTAFFDCWTKKEAYVKAMGDGMSLPLPKLTISSESPDGLSVIAMSKETQGWNFESFFAEENYIASIVYEDRKKKVSYFRWTQ